MKVMNTEHVFGYSLISCVAYLLSLPSVSFFLCFAGTRSQFYYPDNARVPVELDSPKHQAKTDLKAIDYIAF